MDRRSFVKSSVGLWAFASTSVAFAELLKISPKIILAHDSADPIQNMSSQAFDSIDFNGDNVNLPHDILWDIDGFILKNGGLPLATEHVPVIVIGGGMSGLLTQYFQAKKTKTVLLEQDKFLGGNSKGEIYKDISFSIGAAYVTVPDENSDIDLFFKDIGLRDLFRHEEASDVSTFFKKQVIKNFSSGDTAPEFKKQFEIINARLSQILENEFPEIPHNSNSNLTRQQLNELDSISFLDWMRELLKTEPHAHLLEYYQLYCWSSFTASIDELSAAQVLNFVASEVSGVLALPGGNALIASTIYKKLQNNILSDVRSSSFVLDVRTIDDKVQVSYLNVENKIVSMTADKVFVCCPKNVARRIIKNIPANQDKAFEDISFRGYIVGNVLLDSKIKSSGYDLFVQNGEYPETPSAMRPYKQGFADMIFADWSNFDQSQRSVLTLYRPLSYDGARQFLFSPMAHDKNKKKIVDELETLLPFLGLNSSNILGVRLTRWGHSLPVAKKGWISSGQPEIVSRPIEDKIYFVNQDNWVNPSFETCFAEAMRWATNG